MKLNLLLIIPLIAVIIPETTLLSIRTQRFLNGFYSKQNCFSKNY